MELIFYIFTLANTVSAHLRASWQFPPIRKFLAKFARIWRSVGSKKWAKSIVFMSLSLLQNSSTQWKIFDGWVTFVLLAEVCSLLLVQQAVDQAPVHLLMVQLPADALEGPGEFLAVQGHSDTSVGVNIRLLVFCLQLLLILFLLAQLLVNFPTNKGIKY